MKQYIFRVKAKCISILEIPKLNLIGKLSNSSSVDVQGLEELFKSDTPSSQDSPAGWTGSDSGPTVATDKVAPATLVDLGHPSELDQTHLNNDFQ